MHKGIQQKILVYPCKFGRGIAGFEQRIFIQIHHTACVLYRCLNSLRILLLKPYSLGFILHVHAIEPEYRKEDEDEEDGIISNPH